MIQRTMVWAAGELEVGLLGARHDRSVLQRLAPRVLGGPGRSSSSAGICGHPVPSGLPPLQAQETAVCHFSEAALGLHLPQLQVGRYSSCSRPCMSRHVM